MLALVALLTALPELTVDVPLYLSAGIEEQTLADALEEVDAIFAPGGIRLRFALSPVQPVADPVVVVVLQPRPSRFVVHGCSRDRHDHRLGHTHLRGRRITLWSEQIARAVDGNWDRKDVPDVDEGVFARALGRVLAHELGHLFLSLNGHRANGLMRSAFSHRSLIARGRRAFRLDESDLKQMRSSLERMTAASR